MPIERLNADAFSIRELTFGCDIKGNYLSFVCPKAIAYVLCFSSNQPISREDLMQSMSEEDIGRLYEQGELKKDMYRLQCVHKPVFDAMPTFRDFNTVPPEQIQVWSMVPSADGTFKIYVPDHPAAQMCYVALQYSFTFSQSETIRRPDQKVVGTLRACINNSEKYTDGALQYQVGDALPIPLTKEMLNRDIPILVEQGKIVRCLVDEQFKGKYMQTTHLM